MKEGCVIVLTCEFTFKDIEGTLYSYKQTLAEINAIELEIEELSDQYQGIFGKRNTIPSSSTNKVIDTVYNEVAKREDDINRLLNIKRCKERQIKKIENMITILTEEEREFVRLKYFEMKKGKEIEDILLLSRDGCSSRRKKAIMKLTDFLNSTYKFREGVKMNED